MKQITRGSIPLLVILATIFLLSKHWHQSANPSDLSFLISPTAEIVGFMSGQNLTTTDTGEVLLPTLNIIINKSCAGFNFLIILAPLLIFRFYKRRGLLEEISRGLLLTSISIVLVWLLNSVRIISSIYILKVSLPFAPRVTHEVIGVVTYATALLLLYNFPTIIHSLKERYAQIQ